MKPSKERPTALDRQRSVYLNGMRGKKPTVPTGVQELEAAAIRRMSSAAEAYIVGGAGSEHTIANNRDGFRCWQIVPRMLRDVETADFSTELLGMQLPLPLLLAPIGVLEMVHPQADRAVGQAAALAGIPYIFSNQASVAMEEVAEAMGQGPRWFQLYWSKSDELVRSLVQRAEACGCSAIVVTLDTTMLGWRNRDLDRAYLPFLRGQGLAQYISDPVFQRLIQEPEPEEVAPRPRPTLQLIRELVQLNRRYPGNWWSNLRSGVAQQAVRKFIQIYTNPSLDWDQIIQLRKHTRLPILLKGILHSADALKALDSEVDGIIVSNHGGRQVDGALSAIVALEGIAQVVKGRIPVLMDSGIRTGADVFKALALGADAVCLGRPYVYGLTLAGAGGVREVIENLTAEFELTARLAGCRNVTEIRQATLLPTHAKTQGHG